MIAVAVGHEHRIEAIHAMGIEQRVGLGNDVRACGARFEEQCLRAVFAQDQVDELRARIPALHRQNGDFTGQAGGVERSREGNQRRHRIAVSR